MFTEMDSRYGYPRQTSLGAATLRSPYDSAAHVCPGQWPPRRNNLTHWYWSGLSMHSSPLAELACRKIQAP